MGKGDKEGFVFIRGIPSMLKRKFKAWCARHDTTMTDQIVKFMAEKTGAHVPKRCTEDKHDQQPP